jgi:hypothetical protein
MGGRFVRIDELERAGPTAPLPRAAGVASLPGVGG